MDPRFAPFGDELFEWTYERKLLPSDIGRPTHRMVRVGMPRLRKDLIDCAFFLYGRAPDGRIAPIPDGTGSIVCRKDEHRRPHYYAVSNWHLTNDIGTKESPGPLATNIRLNAKEGPPRFLEYGPTDWHFVDGGHDVSAVDITDELEQGDRYFAIPSDLFITEWVRFKYELAGGDDVLMIGMFADHYGKEENIPAVRFGNLSLLANKDNQIEQENNTKQPSHIADMRSRSGFSGSPVLVFRNYTADLNNAFQWKRNLADENDPFKSGPYHLSPPSADAHFIGFLGVHCGQFWERVKFRKPQNMGEKAGDPIVEGDEIEIQGGMTVIAPAWRVNETLDLKVFEEMRQKREEERGKGRPRAESIFEKSEERNKRGNHAANLSARSSA